jgi:hypothetical protein
VEHNARTDVLLVRRLDRVVDVPLAGPLKALTAALVGARVELDLVGDGKGGEESDAKLTDEQSRLLALFAA